MAKVGSVEIVGSIDVTSINHGLRQMKQGLDEAKSSAKASFGDIKRLGDGLSSIADPLTKIGVALGTTMLGIAAMSPAVAPVLARMQADFLRLSRILGEELKPIFEEAEIAFEGFVDFMGSDTARNAMSWVVDEMKDMKDNAAALQEQFSWTTPYIEKFIDAFNKIPDEGVIPTEVPPSVADYLPPDVVLPPEMPTPETPGLAGDLMSVANVGEDIIKSFSDIQPGTLDVLWKPAAAATAAITETGLTGFFGEDYLTDIGGMAAKAGEIIVSPFVAAAEAVTQFSFGQPLWETLKWAGIV